MVSDIDRDELKRKLDHPKKIVLVDALPEDEFRKLIPDKDVEVIVYCTGPPVHAAVTAANEFNAMGYSNVRRYVGGKHDWPKAHLPVVGEGDQRAIA